MAKILEQHAQEVRLADSEGDSILVDQIENALVTVDFQHHEIYQGNTFLASWKSPEGSDIADDGVFGLYLQTADRLTHLTFELANGGDLEVAFWEGCSFSATGTQINLFNLNRMSSRIPTVEATVSPTLITGTLIENFFVPGGTGPVQASGGTGQRDTEWNLRTGTAYYLQGINRAGTATPASIVTQWYEEDL